MYAHNSTIKIKKKICKRCGELKYIFSRGRCSDCARIEDHQPIDEHSDNEFPELIKECDDLFSKYIRLKYADADGIVKCFTCEIKKHWTLIQNGHYISRGNIFLRFDERNCRPQEEFCNCTKHGNIPEFTRRLEEEHPGITEILNQEAFTVYKYSRDELQKLKAEFKLKISYLQQR